MDSTEVISMTPEHPRWNEFQNLVGEACGIWECDNTTNLATAVLAEHFIDCDVEGSVSYWADHGGYCWCEVLFNVGV